MTCVVRSVSRRPGEAMFSTANNMAFPRLHDASASASQRRFVQVDSLPTIACAGLVAVAVEPDGTLLAAANYYGASAVFSTGGMRAAHEVQRVPLHAGLSMAHDWEVARVSEATTLLIVVGDGHSLVFLLRDQPGAPQASCQQSVVSSHMVSSQRSAVGCGR